MRVRRQGIARATHGGVLLGEEAGERSATQQARYEKSDHHR